MHREPCHITDGPTDPDDAEERWDIYDELDGLELDIEIARLEDEERIADELVSTLADIARTQV